jgi:hypothetical protein
MVVEFHEPIQLLLVKVPLLPQDSQLLRITDQYLKLKDWIAMQTNPLLPITMELTKQLLLRRLTILVSLLPLVARA